MSMSYHHAAIYAQILCAEGKMMRLLGLFQQAASFLRKYYRLIGGFLRFSKIRSMVRSTELVLPRLPSPSGFCALSRRPNGTERKIDFMRGISSPVQCNSFINSTQSARWWSLPYLLMSPRKSSCKKVSVPASGGSSDSRADTATPPRSEYVSLH